MSNNKEEIRQEEFEKIVKLKERNARIKSMSLAILFGLPTIIIFLLPAFKGEGSRYFIDTFSFVFLFAAMALSLNLEVGFLGLPNFGKVAFIAVGAYTYALTENLNLHWFGPVFITGIILSVIVTGLFGVILTLPTLRLREDYLAIVTIVAGEILRMVLNNEESLGGYSGFPVTNEIFIKYDPQDLISGKTLDFYPFIALTILVAVSIYFIIKGEKEGRKHFDEIKSKKFALDKSLGITTFIAVIIGLLNYEGIFGQPYISLDIFLMAIPLSLILQKTTYFIKMRPLTTISIAYILAIIDFISGFFVIDSPTTINTANWYYMLFTFVIMLIIYVIMQQIYLSPFGRALRAIREDDTSAISVGKSLFSFRLRALFLANALTGLAGAAFAMLLSSVTPQTFLPLFTFQLYIMVIIGGSGNNKGVIYGAIVIQLLIQSTRRLSNIVMYYPFLTKNDILGWGRTANPFNLALIIVGITLILFLIFAPEGIFPEETRNNNRYTDLLYLNEETPDIRDANQLLVALKKVTGYKEGIKILQEDQK